MKRTIYIVCKRNFETKFLQNADMFEKFKFVGFVAEGVQDEEHSHLSPQEILDRSQKGNTEDISVVGIMVPNYGAAFLPEHTVYSDGKTWIPVEDLCRQYNSFNEVRT